MNDSNKLLDEIQKKFRDLENVLKIINNREIELSIVRLQECAHWAYHGIARYFSDKK